MTARLKLPAYGRELREARDAGMHPERILIIYGDAIQRPDGALCVFAADYQPGTIDWSVVAGVPADIEWRNGELARELVAELAAVTAPVHAILPSGHRIEASEFLYGEMARADFPLWSQDIERDYFRRWEELNEARLADLGRA
jgi:hypothetical protein